MPIPKELKFKDEAAFRDEYLIPLIQRLGFSIVFNYHGQAEFGKDIIFGDIDRFGREIFFGMPAKYLPSISQKNSHCLVDDVVEAFTHPFTHPQTGKEEYISKFYVANAGSIAPNARANFFKRLATMNIRKVSLLDGQALKVRERWASVPR